MKARRLFLAACLIFSALPAEAQDIPLRVARSPVRAIEGITVDVDASALRDSSNLRLAVVPASSAEEVGDPQAFYLDSVAVRAGRMRLTLPGGPPGADEVRLYHIPRSATEYRVAARAPVVVTPGVPGARLVRDLAREALALGAVKFDAAYRGKTIRVEAQFLRVRPETEWDYRWLSGATALARRPVAVLSLGMRSNSAASLPEMECLIDAGADAALQKVASLNPGDSVLMQGSPSAWGAGAAQALTLDGCAFGSP